MSELTDLEICKRIAEIEGLDFEESTLRFKRDSKVIGRIILSEEYCLDHDIENEEYDPLTDKALCFDLMIKHRIILSPVDVGFKALISFTQWVINENPKRAICLAVIKKHEE